MHTVQKPVPSNGPPLYEEITGASGNKDSQIPGRGKQREK